MKDEEERERWREGDEKRESEREIMHTVGSLGWRDGRQIQKYVKV